MAGGVGGARSVVSVRAHGFSVCSHTWGVQARRAGEWCDVGHCVGAAWARRGRGRGQRGRGWRGGWRGGGGERAGSAPPSSRGRGAQGRSEAAACRRAGAHRSGPAGRAGGQGRARPPPPRPMPIYLRARPRVCAPDGTPAAWLSTQAGSASEARPALPRSPAPSGRGAPGRRPVRRRHRPGLGGPGTACQPASLPVQTEGAGGWAAPRSSGAADVTAGRQAVCT